jgi:hypothetical protein
MNTYNPILFLLSAAEVFKNVTRIHNHEGRDYLTIVDVDVELEASIDWKHLQDIRGELCEKSLYLCDFTIPSLPADYNTEVLFVDRDFSKTAYGPLIGYYSTNAERPLWVSKFTTHWCRCYKLKSEYSVE